jgi:hypothetical protein
LAEAQEGHDAHAHPEHEEAKRERHCGDVNGPEKKCGVGFGEKRCISESGI